ncbi:MAG: hypothetical protein RIG82_08690 [Phycisphaeraceae bacterium]
MTTLSIAVWIRPGYAVGLVLCCFVFEQWAQAGSNVFVSYYWLTNYMTALIVLMAFTSMMMQQQMRLPKLGAGAGVLAAMYVYCAISVVWSVDRGETLGVLRSSLIYLIPFGFLAPLAASDTKAIRDGLVMTVVLGLFLLITLLMNPNWSVRGVQLAVEGTANNQIREIGNPLELASLGGYLAIIIALLKLPFLPDWFRWARWLVVGLALTLIIASSSRGQFFASVGVIILMLPFAYKIKSLGNFISIVFGIGIVGVLALVLLQTSTGERFAIANMLENYWDTRLGPSAILLGAWAEAGVLYWLLGLGSSASFSNDIIGFYPHFVPAEVLGELGLVGMGMYLVAYALILRAFYRSFSAVAPFPEARSLVATVFGLALFYSLLTLKQGSFIASYPLMIFFIMIGTIDRDVRVMLAAGAQGMMPQAPQNIENTANRSGERVQPV